jgi:Vta1 like
LTLSPGSYWIVNQIVSKNLQNTDDDCRAYTTSLMDKLEQVGMAQVGREEESKLKLFSSKLRTVIPMFSWMIWPQEPMSAEMYGVAHGQYRKDMDGIRNDISMAIRPDYPSTHASPYQLNLLSSHVPTETQFSCSVWMKSISPIPYLHTLVYIEKK